MPLLGKGGVVNERLVNTFFEMVKIDSESGEEKKFIAYLKDLFTREFQAECTTDDYGNLVVRLAAKNSTRTEPVFFSVHADTVKPGKGIEPVLESGVIRSKGEATQITIGLAPSAKAALAVASTTWGSLSVSAVITNVSPGFS
ncbi:unnamed protein product, partial [marine sediment metagenome]